LIIAELLLFCFIVPFVDTGKPIYEALLPSMASFIESELLIGEADQTTGITSMTRPIILPEQTDYG